MSQVSGRVAMGLGRGARGVCALALVLGATGVALGLEASKEYQVKAAFVFNFAQFVEWPASAFAGKDAPVMIATVGADPFDGALERDVAGKRVGGRAMAVRHDAEGTDEGGGGVQIVFVPESQDGHVAEVLGHVAGKPVLTVGESEAFMKAGGIIRFYLEDGRVRFEINPEAAQRAGLKVSSKLLGLARIYKQ